MTRDQLMLAVVEAARKLAVTSKALFDALSALDAHRAEVDHASDCAMNNMPAYPAGACTCGATAPPATIELALWEAGPGVVELRLIGSPDDRRNVHGWVRAGTVSLAFTPFSATVALVEAGG
jgi:hypothetical protein